MHAREEDIVYTPEQIAAATGAPLANVQATWPPTLAALDWQHINTHAVRIAIAATIAVETGVTENGKNMTFLPVTELGGPSRSYAPWYGRGTIQCTFEDNYRSFGPRLQPPLNLIANPDLLLQQTASAQFAALYFVDAGIPAMAEAANWVRVRVAVNGGNGVDTKDGGTTNGLDAFLGYVRALQAIAESPDAPPVTTVAVAGALKTEPNHTSPAAIDAQHQPVRLDVGTVIAFCPDPGTGEPWSGKITAGDWAHLRPRNSPEHGWYLRASLVTSGA
jgi:hypothetical protein